MAKAPAVVHAHDMVGMGVRDEHGIHVCDSLPQNLNPHLWRGINDNGNFGGFNVDRWASAMVFWIGQIIGRICSTNDRYAL